MPDVSLRPQMRYVDAIPFEEKNQTYFYIRDPLEVAAKPLVITSFELFILSLLDGRHTIADIQKAFEQRFSGYNITEAQVSQIITVLDDHFFLNTPKFQAQFETLQSEFHHSPVRKAWHAGAAYPAEPDMLKLQLEAFYKDPEGAGIPNISANGKTSANGRQLQAVMAPHIDLRVGGACYTHAYRPLIEEAQPADVYVILGVAHYGGGGFFTITTKDFETPLGVVKTDRRFIEAWRRNAGQDFTRGEWAHRTEHSIEFQLPFLQQGLQHEYTIVPVLCGSLEPFVYNGNRIENVPEIHTAIDALKRTILEDSRRIQIILSVDLAHMGPKFNDPEPITAEKAQTIRAADERMFEVIAGFDTSAFYELMKNDLMPRNVDASSAVYTLLSILPDGEAKAVGYGQNLQPDTNSIVTYGSMTFYGKGF